MFESWKTGSSIIALRLARASASAAILVIGGPSSSLAACDPRKVNISGYSTTGSNSVIRMDRLSRKMSMSSFLKIIPV
jgi:hypothetical protein